MLPVRNTIEMINYALFYTYEAPFSEGNCPWSFYVHTSIMGKWEKVMNLLFTNKKWDIYEHVLQIGTKQYDMRLIIVLSATKDQLSFLRISIIKSQFSFPWEDNPTLFIDAASFNIMEEFIEEHKLEAYILKVEENRGITANNTLIKVVSFNQNVNAKLDVVQEFYKCSHKTKYYYFMTGAFQWQQTHWHSKIRVNDYVYSVLPIILKHLETLKYTNDLDIMDLLSLRWALSDVRRDLYQSTYLKYEIDFMIKRELAKIVKNNHLYLEQYLIAKNSKQIGFLIYYLVYEFQNFFETIDIVGSITPKYYDISNELTDIILLAEEGDFLNKLKKKFNVMHRIDGKGFDKMSLSLFFSLMECHNVITIELDTNFRWVKDFLKLNRTITAYNNFELDIHLKGANTYNFIEDFIAELRTIKFDKDIFSLTLNYRLSDYRILDDLTFKITFVDIEIDENMLDNLKQCNIKPNISLTESCTFEITHRSLELLNYVEKLIHVTIHEKESTWQILFEFVLNEMIKSNSKEFQFNSKSRYVAVHTVTFQSINLGKIKFTVDEQNTKLEIRDLNNNILDLYYEKCFVQPDERWNYEFYE